MKWIAGIRTSSWWAKSPIGVCRSSRYGHSRQALLHRPNSRLDVARSGLPVHYADPHRAASSPGGSCKECATVGNGALNDLICIALVILCCWIEKSNQALIDDG